MTTITDTDILTTLETLTGEKPERDRSTQHFFAWHGQLGLIRFRDTDDNRVASLSIILSTNVLPSDALCRFVATHSYDSGTIGTLAMEIGETEAAVRVAHPVPVAECSEPLLRKTLDALSERAKELKADLPDQGDPRDLAASSAWLLFGDSKSFPDDDDLEEARVDALCQGTFSWTWTTSSKTRDGDLLLFYFISPHKAVHLVARAVGDAYFDPDADILSEHVASRAQWLVDCTPPIRIEPIDFATLSTACGGNLVMRGRSGKYLRPEAVNRLHFQASQAADQDELDWIAETPIGLPDLPDPAHVTIADWRKIADGALGLEEHVSQYLVEPLLQFVGGDFQFEAQVGIPGAGIADYVVRRDGEATCVIEVKQAIAVRADENLEQSKDVAQLRRYRKALNIPGILMDTQSIVLMASDGKCVEVFRRAGVDEDDIATIRSHLTG